MKLPGKMALLTAFVAIVSMSSNAYAGPKPWIWSWWPSHWEDQDFKPYPDNPKHTHYSRFEENDWVPGDWISQRASGDRLIKELYVANILHKQYMDDDMPVLEVGPGFYKLGGRDKRRVLQTVDEVYQITAAKPYGLFMVHDWKTHKPIGAYTQYGLQMK
jgi:hypothetical protein